MNYKKKGIIKDLINKFRIINGVKYSSSRTFQNYLVFRFRNITKLFCICIYILVALLGLSCQIMI